MDPRKKWGIAAIVTGVLFVAIGVIVMVTTATPVWVAVAITVVDVVCSAIGLVLLAKPAPPA